MPTKKLLIPVDAPDNGKIKCDFTAKQWKCQEDSSNEITGRGKSNSVTIQFAGAGSVENPPARPCSHC